VRCSLLKASAAQANEIQAPDGWRIAIRNTKRQHILNNLGFAADHSISPHPDELVRADIV